MAKQLFRNYGAGLLIAAIAIGLWLGYAMALRERPQFKGQTENSDTNPKDQALSPSRKVEPEANPEMLDTNVLFYKALTLGSQAASLTRYAKTPNGWLEISSRWQQAITVLQLVPPGHSQYAEAQKKIREYQKNLAYSNQRLATLVPDFNNKIAILPPPIAAAETPVPPTPQAPVLGAIWLGSNASRVFLNQDLESNKKINEAFVEYQIWTLEHRKNTFQWGLYSSIAIFILVMTIVIFGLFLSYLQFRKGQISETKFSLGKGSIEISSAVIGFLILVLSLIFFYLYLQYVYPIQEIGGEVDSNTLDNIGNADQNSSQGKE